MISQFSVFFTTTALMKLERYFLRLCEISDSEGESDESSRDQSENMQMMDTEFDQFADEVFDEEPRRKEQGTCTSTCTKHLAGGGMSLCNCGEVAGLDFLEKVKERPKSEYDAVCFLLALMRKYCRSVFLF